MCSCFPNQLIPFLPTPTYPNTLSNCITYLLVWDPTEKLGRSSFPFGKLSIPLGHATRNAFDS